MGNLMYPNIDAERARHGMTRDDLAGSLGVSRKTLYNWTHAGNIPQGKLAAMADLFGCSTDYLLSHNVVRQNESR